VDPVAETGGATFTCDRDTLYAVQLGARLPVRIWIRVARFRATTLDGLAAGVRAARWEPYVAPGRPVAVRIASHASRLRHAASMAPKVEHAIRDALRGPRTVAGRRPDRTPLAILVRVEGDAVEVSVDASGDELHRRGWRRHVGEAPLRENLAAAVLALADWDPGEPLVDPMCGAGTFPIEAATIALGILPGASRTFAIETWPSFDRDAWASLRGRTATPPAPRPVISGSDRDGKVIEAARSNARAAGVASVVRLAVADVEELEAPATSGLVVCNPPYGERLRGAEEAWSKLGRALAGPFRGWRVALLVPDRRLLRLARLSLPQVAAFSHGGTRVGVHVGIAGGRIERG
jgi:putative N6-adenine-specific DNA methylase